MLLVIYRPLGYERVFLSLYKVVDHITKWQKIYRPFGYEAVYLPLKVADTLLIQRDDIFSCLDIFFSFGMVGDYF